MSFQLVPDQLEEVEDDVNTAVAVAVATSRNVLMEMEINEEEETPVSQTVTLETQLSNQQVYTSDSSIPEDVQTYLVNFNDSIIRRDIDRIRILHDSTHNSLTFKYYMKSRWPNISAVEHLFDGSSSSFELCRLLYIEQYYRHVFAKFPNHIKWQDRVASWKNYVTLFSYFLSNSCFQTDCLSKQLPNSLKEYLANNNLDTGFENEEIALPPEIVHGVIDEFIYQFQDTCRYRTRIAHLLSTNDQSQGEGRVVKIDQDIWRCDIVLQIFQAFVDLSDIRSVMNGECPNLQIEQLQLINSVDLFPLKYQFGYFSILGLLRVHVLLGNYYIAIETSNGIDNQIFRPLLWKVPSSYVSYLYYLGFSYLMLQRYIDAIRIFQQSTVSFASNSVASSNSASQSSSPYQHDAIGKFVDRMSWLMLFCQLLSYGNTSNFNRMEESLSHQNDRKISTSFAPLGSDISNWKELLSKVSPRFISPSIPLINSKETLFKVDQSEPQQRQMQTFSPLIHLYELSSMIRSFTKLYNNLNVDTLASLMHIAKKNGNVKSREVIKSRQGGENSDSGVSSSQLSCCDDFEIQEPSSIARSQIVAIKSRSGRQRIWKSGGNLLSGEIVLLNGDVDLLLDLDTIHIIEGKQVDRFFGDIFAKQILKARNLLRHIDSLSNKTTETLKKEKV